MGLFICHLNAKDFKGLRVVQQSRIQFMKGIGGVKVRGKRYMKRIHHSLSSCFHRATQ